MKTTTSEEQRKIFEVYCERRRKAEYKWLTTPVWKLRIYAFFNKYFRI